MKKAFLKLMVLSGVVASGGLVAAEVDIAALSQESQRVDQRSNGITMAWWMPQEFWAATFAKGMGASKETDDAMKAIARYTVVAVLDTSADAAGAVNYRTADQLREVTRLTDAWGNTYSPVAEKETDPRMRAVIKTMKPNLVNSLGPMGENMHFLLFPARTQEGDQIADAASKGRFDVKVGKTVLKWRLPLDAVLPAKACGDCSRSCKGSWSFCPWCGTKLAGK